MKIRKGSDGPTLVTITSAELTQLESDKAALVEALRVMVELVRLKYGNLHDDVNQELEKAHLLLATVEGKE